MKDLLAFPESVFFFYAVLGFLVSSGEWSSYSVKKVVCYLHEVQIQYVYFGHPCVSMVAIEQCRLAG